MRLILTSLFIGICLSMTYFASKATAPAAADSPQYHAGKYRNPVAMHEQGFGDFVRITWNFMFNKPAGTVPQQAIPVWPQTQAALKAAPDNTLYRLGHSTMLFKLGGEFYLTDPVFSERASPVQWAGPARFHAPPIKIEDLPPIKAVILSHDHYDHLDYDSIMALAGKTAHFLAPLGVGKRLTGWGVAAGKVREFDWWQEYVLDGVLFAATPAQHFSGRGMGDRNSTLWASWVIRHADLKIYFSGDTGYFAGFKEISKKYGPFDIAMLETGAYDKQWPDIHMQPEETLQAFLDLKATWLMPVHNGTFDLGMHRWQDPFERITALAAVQGISITTPEMGEPLNMKQPHPGRTWWKNIK